MSAIGKTITKVKAGVKEVTATPKRAAVHVATGFVLGVIVDLIFEFFVNYWKAATGELEGPVWHLPFAWGIFTGNEWVHLDDVILIIISVVLFFTKKFLFAASWTLGWYISSEFRIYQTLGLPSSEDLK